jgi:hypothetical protein
MALRKELSRRRDDMRNGNGRCVNVRGGSGRGGGRVARRVSLLSFPPQLLFQGAAVLFEVRTAAESAKAIYLAIFLFRFG